MKKKYNPLKKYKGVTVAVDGGVSKTKFANGIPLNVSDAQLIQDIPFNWLLEITIHIKGFGKILSEEEEPFRTPFPMLIKDLSLAVDLVIDGFLSEWKGYEYSHSTFTARII